MLDNFITHLSKGRKVTISSLIFPVSTTFPFGSLMLMYGESSNSLLVSFKKITKVKLPIFFVTALSVFPYRSQKTWATSSPLIVFDLVITSVKGLMFNFATISYCFGSKCKHILIDLCA